MDRSELEKLITYVEENTRADQVSGIEFIDPRNFKSKVKGRQNYVVFGRRGAGKSTLLKTLQEDLSVLTIYVNLEDFKDITFPNIIIKVLLAFFERIIEELNQNRSFWRKRNYFKANKLKKRINQVTKLLENKLEAPDRYDERNKKVLKKEASDTAGVKMGPLSGNTSYKTNDESEVEHSWEINKLNELKTSIDKVKSLIKEIIDFNNKQIFLILDDFYFLPKKIQPFLLDYFHRLAKSNSFYLKVGTIKHRSHLY
ncbi:MAG: P-loop NTPase fold protein, partial [Cyclobacteriaceae bacterium]